MQVDFYVLRKKLLQKDFLLSTKLLKRIKTAAANRCVYKIVAGRMRIRLLFAILLLWLVEADVFQIPQLHKHLIVGRNIKTYMQYGII
jgi:hypothetical protein